MSLNLALAAALLAAGVALVHVVKQTMREQALEEAESKTRLLLDHYLGVHTYFSHQLKPSLFEFTEPFRDAAYFEPRWMSSTYAVREMDAYADDLAEDGHYYKECAINARSPQNEADEYERRFLERLNEDPELVVDSDIRVLDGEPFFVTLRRGEAMEQSCLRCHSTPEEAPQQMVAAYGPERSFGRHEDDVVSAVSIRIPLSSAFAKADMFSRRLFWILLFILAGVFALQYIAYAILIGRPLGVIHRTARAITENDAALGRQVPVARVRELHDVSVAFNGMSARLRRHVDNLEEQVAHRTRELAQTNESLEAEVAERRRAEEQKQETIERLEQTLDEVRTLRDIVPVCLHCKSIRSDEGYWMQVDNYVTKHMRLRVSHGICPECMKSHYGDLLDEENAESS